MTTKLDRRSFLPSLLSLAAAFWPSNSVIGFDRVRGDDCFLHGYVLPDGTFIAIDTQVGAWQRLPDVSGQGAERSFVYKVTNEEIYSFWRARKHERKDVEDFLRSLLYNETHNSTLFFEAFFRWQGEHQGTPAWGSGKLDSLLTLTFLRRS